jgi:hypothetical protein
MKKRNLTYWYLFLTMAFIISQVELIASSHREAPLIANDPLADNVDLYAFRSPDAPNTVTLIATYVPMQIAHGGPNYFGFGENIRYEIHVDNDASIPGDEITYRFTFRKVNEDPTTFFNIRLGKENLKTTYTLERSLDNGKTWTTIIANGIVPPNNIGPRSIEGGAGMNKTYASLFASGISNATTGEKVFAGNTDDPFFVDLGGVFDLGDMPRQVGKPVDGLACMNVSTIAIQVPIATLLKKGAPATPRNILDADYVIGVWASASRRMITTLSSTSNPAYSGEWVQVSRLGMPLTNEAVIPIGRKDFWNSLTPYQEIADTTLDQYFFNPELALYMDDAAFGGAVPAFGPLRIQKKSLGSFNFANGANGLQGLKGNAALAGTALDDKVFGTLLLPGNGKPRSVDLWPAFHTGVPNVIPYQLATGKNGNPLAAGKPFVHNFLPNGGDMLRLNMAVPITPRNDPNFSSLGLIQAAVLGLTAAPFNTNTNIEFIPNMDGFPNGRRLEDDVTRIELQAVSGVVLAAVGLWYDDFTAGTSASPVTNQLLNVLTYTSGVERNDKPFTAAFPYVAMPSRGTGDCFSQIGKPVATTSILKTVFTSSNTSKKVGVVDLNSDKSLSEIQFVTRGTDADGVHYDATTDMMIQLNRSSNRLDVYGSVTKNARAGIPPVYMYSSASDFDNGREITVIGDRVIVAQDAATTNNNQNKLVVYKWSSNALELKSTYNVAINLWGIHADLNTLYAVVDNADGLAVFENFFQNANGNITPTRTIKFDGIVRTHGLAYDFNKDIMIMTDIGDAASATDGGIVVVNDFKTKSADNIIALSEQIIIKGDNTQLGNPVDVSFDETGKNIFVAERANGKVLVFNTPTTNGNFAPYTSIASPGVSAIYLLGSTRAGQPTTPVKEIPSEDVLKVKIYPNPTSTELNLDWSAIGDVNVSSNIIIYNGNGQKVINEVSDSNRKSINVSQLPQGWYTVSLQNKLMKTTQVFIKQ